MSLSGQKKIRTAYRSLPQVTYFSPIIFNVYSYVIINTLLDNSFRSLSYADSIVIFTKHTLLDSSVLNLNTALD